MTTTTDEVRRQNRKVAQGELAELLFAAYRAGCSPSLRQMESMAWSTEHGLRAATSAATFSRILRGLTFPQWGSVKEILLAVGVDTATIESVWRPRWIRARAGELPLDPVVTDEPAGDEPAVIIDRAVSECPECGALVINHDRHRAWHQAFRAQAGNVVLRLAN